MKPWRAGLNDERARGQHGHDGGAARKRQPFIGGLAGGLDLFIYLQTPVPALQIGWGALDSRD
jgi:hypothetical protein